MAYIGNTPTTQAFAPAIDYFSGNGSTVAFTLSRPVASVAQVQVNVNNVQQNPSTAFTVSGQTLTFSGAPSSGTNNIYVEYTSPITQVQGLTQGPSVIGPMYVSINGATPLGGATNPILGTSGSANNYVQSYVLNQTNGASSSADFTAYPSNGTDAAGWVDIGITSLSYSSATYSITGPNESYLFGSAPSGSGTTGNLVIATDSTGTSNAIQFYVGGFAQSKSAWKMQLTTSGMSLAGSIFEAATITAAAPSATTNFDVSTQSVQYYTTNTANNWTLNLRGNSSTSLNSVLAVGQSATIALLVANGGTAYYMTAIQVDGVGQTIKWQGGTAPTSGNTSATDVYSVTVIKTASATYTVLASQTKFA